MTATIEAPRVGVNLTWLVPGVVGGSEEYTVRTLLGLSELATRRPESHRFEVTLFARPDLLEAHPELGRRFATILMPTGLVDRFRGLAEKSARVVLEQTWLARVTAGQELVHHAGGVVPLVRPTPSVVTIHDLQPLDQPENFGPVKRSWLGMMIGPSARVARLVLCPSRFTAQSVIDRFGIPDASVRVVPHGYDLDRSCSGPAAPGSHRSPGFAPGRYLLLPAITYPHKRHIDAVRAMTRLSVSHPDVGLVLTGGVGPSHQAVLDEIAAAGLSDRVVHLGRVSRERLEGLYREAAALVFPSAYEGFGNPVLEAMLFGCPVVAADATALTELVGDAGLLHPVGDVDALVAAVTSVLDHPDRAAALVERGRIRAAEHTVEASARALADAYHDAIRAREP